MKVYIKNLYGINDGIKAYYRKLGDSCFDFVSDQKYSSELTKDEAEKIMQYTIRYKNQYKASEMGVEE